MPLKLEVGHAGRAGVSFFSAHDSLVLPPDPRMARLQSVGPARPTLRLDIATALDHLPLATCAARPAAAYRFRRE
jgi:hypothetical protein